MDKSELLKIVSAVEKTRDDILAWAYSDMNKGPFAGEAYRTNVHVGSALNILSDTLRALAKEEG